MYRVWGFLSTYSVLLLAGAVIALFWANLAPESYRALVDFELWSGGPIGHAHVDAEGHVHHTMTFHFLINDIGMAFFFAIAAKEVWEGLALKGGELRGRKSLTPLIATAGGMMGPVAIYLLIGLVLGADPALTRGWAIPTATDIAFSYLVGRMIFGAGHPAIRFLLLLAIADDAGGMIILAIFYPTGEVAPLWLLVSFGTAVAVYLLANLLPRRMDAGRMDRPVSTWVRQRLSFWPYALAGAISWYAFHQAGLHPALGLLPIVPTVPHEDQPFGPFAEAEAHARDLLNVIAQKLKYGVEVMLFFFGLLNAGVVFSAVGDATWMVLGGLIIGKPVGIFLFGYFSARVLGLGLPGGMTLRDLWALGMVAAIGFTVALFVAGVAFPVGPVQDAARMGAVLSFGAGALALVAARALGIRPLKG